MTNFCSNSSSSSPCSSSSCCLARRTMMNRYGKLGGGGGGAHPAWSMSSLMTALPEIESPSPICSCSLHAHKCDCGTHTSDNATHFSTPRNQRFGIRCIDSNDKDDDNNNCFSDIDEWLEHANKFCCNHHLTETLHEEQDMRISAVVCNNYLTAPEHQLYNIILPSVREESPLHLTAYKLSERTRLMPRPPYDHFLNHVTRKKLQAADRDAAACNKAKHVRLMHRLRRKEDAINDWEMQQTRKAMDRMDKIQNELERKQVMASARTQKKICSVREKAEKLKLNLRQSTMKKYRWLQTSETTPRSPSCSWDSRLPLC